MSSPEVRLSAPTLKVLKLFIEAPRTRRSGAEISRLAGIGSGTLYPLLARLEGAGWSRSAWETVDPREAGRPRRRLYAITALGQTKTQDAFTDLQLVMGVPVWSS